MLSFPYKSTITSDWPIGQRALAAAPENLLLFIWRFKSALSLPTSKARIGGVALDQAAKFLANMSDITGAYYDQNKDRIVFVFYP